MRQRVRQRVRVRVWEGERGDNEERSKNNQDTSMDYLPYKRIFGPRFISISPSFVDHSSLFDVH